MTVCVMVKMTCFTQQYIPNTRAHGNLKGCLFSFNVLLPSRIDYRILWRVSANLSQALVKPIPPLALAALHMCVV